MMGLYHNPKFFSRVSVYYGIKPYTFSDEYIAEKTLESFHADDSTIKINNIKVGETAEYKSDGDIYKPHKTAVEDKGQKCLAS